MLTNTGDLKILSLSSRFDICFSNYFSISTRHTLDKLLKVFDVELNPLSFDLLEEILFSVALALSHFSINLTPQVLDRVEIWRLRGPRENANILVTHVISADNRSVFRVVVLLKDKILPNELPSTWSHVITNC